MPEAEYACSGCGQIVVREVKRGPRPKCVACSVCTIEGCRKPAKTRGWCSRHYFSWRKYGDPLTAGRRAAEHRLDLTQRKTCIQCDREFGPISGRAHHQWAKQRFCSRPCKNRHAAQQQRPSLKTQKRWAMAWARQRRIEDRADLRAWQERQHRRQVRIDAATKPLPGPRHWMAGTCAGHRCHQPLVFIQKGQWKKGTVSYCDACRQKRWRMNHRQRARYHGVAYESINHFDVFAADDHRCQLCHRKTVGKYPHPRSPTLDHIIPLALGGPHQLHNVQTACLECNTKKGTNAANDQLRLALV